MRISFPSRCQSKQGSHSRFTRPVLPVNQVHLPECPCGSTLLPTREGLEIVDAIYMAKHVSHLGRNYADMSVYLAASRQFATVTSLGVV